MVVAAPPARARPATGGWTAAAVGVGLWTGLVLVALRWGASVAADRPEMRVNAAPFVGAWERLITDRAALWAAIALGVLVVAGAPVLTRRLPWRALVVGAGALGVAWLLALNAVDGPDALRAPLTTRYEYVAGVADVDAAGGARAYLSGFTEQISDYPTHVRGHPPGLVVGLWASDQVGLDPLAVNLGLVLAGWAAAIASALVAVREVVGVAGARRMAPLLAMAPAAIWAGTSADALFAGVTAAAIALLVLATGQRGRRSDLTAVAGGALVGISMLLSYATTPVLAVPVAVALARGRLRSLFVGGAVAAAVLVVMGVAGGFWWPAGLLATREQYQAGLAPIRPYRYFVVGNLAAVAVAVGPVLGAGVAVVIRRLIGAGADRAELLRRLAPTALVVGAVVGVVAADLSGLSKGETERIWLVFVPWLAGAAAFLPGPADRVHRVWVAAQVALGVGLQVALRTPW